MDDQPALAELVGPGSIRLDGDAASRDDAIRLVGSLLTASGAVDAGYVDAMLEREASVSTYVGEGIAFPHATLVDRDAVHHDALAVVRFPAGVDWDGHDVRVAIGIAARGRGHIRLLSRLATMLLSAGTAAALLEASSDDEVRALLDDSGDPGAAARPVT
jgi:PTS system mannitol-specific IIA component